MSAVDCDERVANELESQQRVLLGERRRRQFAQRIVGERKLDERRADACERSAFDSLDTIFAQVEASKSRAFGKHFWMQLQIGRRNIRHCLSSAYVFDRIFAKIKSLERYEPAERGSRQDADAIRR